MNELQSVLVDPESARLTFVTKNEDTICGFVNARNRMGGYTGDQAFFMRPEEPPLIVPVGSRAMRELGNCQGTDFAMELIDRSLSNTKSELRELNDFADSLGDGPQ